GADPMTPQASRVTPEVAEKLADLVEQGATVLSVQPPSPSPSLSSADSTGRVASAVRRMQCLPHRFIQGAWRDATLDRLGCPPDLLVKVETPHDAHAIAWDHRASDAWDAYFLSNQLDEPTEVRVQVRASRRHAELWDPVNGSIQTVEQNTSANDRTALDLRLAAGQSVLLVLRDDGPSPQQIKTGSPVVSTPIAGPWRLSFQAAVGFSPAERTVSTLVDLSLSEDDEIRHFAGATFYETSFAWTPTEGSVWIDVGEAAPLAEIELNSQPCGVLWTAPWRLEVSGKLRPGENRLRVRAPSTWKNRLIGDAGLREEDRASWTSAPARLPDRNLTRYGLIGPVQLISE
ncbi:MAG: hypothetical protein KDA37_06955, partial [Planctomycetales bacterium]|nr:hypothetical protein [Planctomycetales bacterium]